MSANDAIIAVHEFAVESQRNLTCPIHGCLKKAAEMSGAGPIYVCDQCEEDQYIQYKQQSVEEQICDLIRLVKDIEVSYNRRIVDLERNVKKLQRVIIQLWDEG